MHPMITYIGHGYLYIFRLGTLKKSLKNFRKKVSKFWDFLPRNFGKKSLEIPENPVSKFLEILKNKTLKILMY